MKKESKYALIIALTLYVIFHALSVIRSFDANILSNITILGSAYIPITTVILLAYVWNRGDETIAKIGLACIAVSTIITILTLLEFISPGYLATKTIDKIFKFVDTVASLGTSLTSMLALFSIIPISDETSKKLQSTAIISYIIYAIIVVSGNVLDLQKVRIIGSLRTLIYAVSLIAEYGMIVTYLLNKNSESTTPVIQQPQVQQPINQQVPNQMPVQNSQMISQMPQQVPQQPQQVYQQQPVPQAIPQQYPQQVQQPVQQPQQVQQQYPQQ